MPLYTSGQISNGICAASAALNANRDQEMAAVQNLKLAVADAFVLVFRATPAVRARHKANVDSLQGDVTDVGNLFNKGLVPLKGLLTVQVSLSLFQQCMPD